MFGVRNKPRSSWWSGEGEGEGEGVRGAYYGQVSRCHCGNEGLPWHSGLAGNLAVPLK